jgi:2-iminobutanoate/2-iminopropanoate deaminase
MRTVETDKAPRPAGHYSQGVVHGGFLFVSGQLPIDPRTGEKSAGAIEEQAALALANVLAIVEAAGSSSERVVRTTAYVTDVALWGRVNEVYERVFGEHRPARSVVPVPSLHHGFLIEIEAVAAV